MSPFPSVCASPKFTSTSPMATALPAAILWRNALRFSALRCQVGRKSEAHSAIRPPRCRSAQRREDRLRLEIGFETVRAHLAAPAGLLVAAAGQGHVRDELAIDPDEPGL